MTERITLWRVSNYASLEGTGGLYVSGRWHTKGHPVVYCSEDPSTALLETLVHIEIDSEDRPETFQVLKIESSHEVSIEQIDTSKLGSEWRGNLAERRAWATNGYSRGEAYFWKSRVFSFRNAGTI